MSNLSRRNFVKGSFAATAAVGALSAMPTWARPIGANDDIRVAVVGLNSQGGGHLDRLLNIKGVRVVAIVDPDTAVLDKRAKIADAKGVKVKKYQDIRKLLESGEVDAITTASPNHWHALISIWACQAGVDVYVEKPCSHNVWEGRQLVNAAKKYKRVVQIGTQMRSDKGHHEAIAWAKAGNLGKVLLSRGTCYKRRASIGKVKGPQAPPSTIDYDLWTGPAAMGPLMREKLHYDWHWDFNTGCGDLGNQGIHQMDVAFWATNETKLSPLVMSVGGRFGYDDDGNTANTQFVVHAYDDVPVVFEVRGLPAKADVRYMDNYKGSGTGNVIHCEGGYILTGASGGGAAFDNAGKRIIQFKADGGGNHIQNFIDAVRAGDPNLLNGKIEPGHIASGLCHTGNISYRLGTLSKVEEIRESMAKSSDLVKDTFDRFKDHLAANNIDINIDQAALGPWLKMNPNTERFAGNGEYIDMVANSMISRNYRAPYVVPEIKI